MTQNNSDSGKPDEPSSDSKSTPKPRKKKRRLLLKIAAALVVLIVLLVGLAPTIISTGLVRGIVVGQINSSALNGKLQIKDWSFGWTSGVRIEGVSLDDANNEHLLSVAEISTPISLLKAATGNIDLGDVIIKGVDFNAVIDSAGELNFLKALKPSNKPPSNEKPSKPSKLPQVKGTIHLQDVTGTFQDDPDKVTVGIPPRNPLNVTVAIKDINQPIEDEAVFGLQLDEKNFVSVNVNGTVSAIRNNLVDADHLAVNQNISFVADDLSPVSQVLHSNHLNLDLTGKMTCGIRATVDTPDKISAGLVVELSDASAGGRQLQGDTLAVQQLLFSTQASVTSSAGKNPAIKLDMLLCNGKDASQIDQNRMIVQADVAEDSLLGMADAFKAIAARLAKAPSSPQAQPASIPGAGNILIDAQLNVASLVNQVPHLVHLEKSTSLKSGQLSHRTTITLANGQAVIKTKTQLKDFSGTNAGTPVQLNDIDAAAALTAVGGDHPDLRDVNLSFSTPSPGFKAAAKLWENSHSRPAAI